MKSFAIGMGALALLGMTACTDNMSRPRDTGSMQTPAARATGDVSTSSPTTQTGSMQQPAPTGGVTVRQQTRPDTGNMALPNRAQGNAGTTRY